MNLYINYLTKKTLRNISLGLICLIAFILNIEPLYNIFPMNIYCAEILLYIFWGLYIYFLINCKYLKSELVLHNIPLEKGSIIQKIFIYFKEIGFFCIFARILKWFVTIVAIWTIIKKLEITHILTLNIDDIYAKPFIISLVILPLGYLIHNSHRLDWIFYEEFKCKIYIWKYIESRIIYILCYIIIITIYYKYFDYNNYLITSLIDACFLVLMISDIFEFGGFNNTFFQNIFEDWKRGLGPEGGPEGEPNYYWISEEPEKTDSDSSTDYLSFKNWKYFLVIDSKIIPTNVFQSNIEKLNKLLCNTEPEDMAYEKAIIFSHSEEGYHTNWLWPKIINNLNQESHYKLKPLVENRLTQSNQKYIKYTKYSQYVQSYSSNFRKYYVMENAIRYYENNLQGLYFTELEKKCFNLWRIKLLASYYNEISQIIKMENRTSGFLKDYTKDIYVYNELIKEYISLHPMCIESFCKLEFVDHLYWNMRLSNKLSELLAYYYPYNFIYESTVNSHDINHYINNRMPKSQIKRLYEDTVDDYKGWEQMIEEESALIQYISLEEKLKISKYKFGLPAGNLSIKPYNAPYFNKNSICIFREFKEQPGNIYKVGLKYTGESIRPKISIIYKPKPNIATLGLNNSQSILKMNFVNREFIKNYRNYYINKVD